MADLVEPLDAGDDDARVPSDLLELHEVLEWLAAVEAAETGEGRS